MLRYLLFIFSFFILLSFQWTQKVAISELPIEKIERQYKNDLRDFQKRLTHFVDIVETQNFNEKSRIDFQQEFSELRIAYKRIEYLVEYFNREAVANFINGAPLPKVETSAPGITIAEPNGLQRLDELIFTEEIETVVEDIVPLTQKLYRFWNEIYVIESQRKLQYRYVFEAARYQLIRVFALGLTGFDTPGSVQAIPEAIASIESMKRCFEAFEGLPKIGQRELRDGSLLHLNKFLAFLQSGVEFDELDRMHALRTYINPLYKSIYSLQKKMLVEFVDEVDPTAQAVNYHAQNIFSDSFLNPGFFAQIASQDLNDPKKIALGKVLFYDPILSEDVTMSCASCHNPDRAFTDGLIKSKSRINNHTTTRNSPTLINSVYSEKYFHDLREYDLERQVKHVVNDVNEFNMNFIALADRLKESPEYINYFKEAYGDRDKYIISSWSISNSLAAYVASLRSWNSPFDRYARGETKNISPNVIRGFNLFMGKAACGTCHFAPTFSGVVPPYYRESESEVLGVPSQADTSNATVDNDAGRRANGRAIDNVDHFMFSFKTTTVRNIALTAPYMHNGVYKTLEQVLDFYNRGGGAGIGIDLEFQTLAPDPLGLSKDEIGDIISFMQALTDTAHLTVPSVILPEFPNEKYASRMMVNY